MNCPQCGSALSAAALFCRKCGAKIEPLDTQAKQTGRSQPEIEDTEPGRKISNHADLNHLPDLCLVIGFAEDGMPLALSIKRSEDMLGRIKDFKRTLPANDPLAGHFETSINSLQAVIEQAWVRQGLTPLKLPDGKELTCFIPSRNIGDLFNATLLGKLIPVPPGLENGWEGQKAVGHATQRMAAEARGGGQPAIFSSGGQNRFLALSAEDARAFVVSWDTKDDDKSIVYQREFLPESLQFLKGSTFRLERRDQSFSPPKLVAQGNLLQLDSFLQGLQYGEMEIKGLATFKQECFVPRSSVTDVISKLLYILETYHASDKVHGDLKPNNILLTAQGIVLIDDLSLVVGQISPAASPGWAAPEQIIGQPVSHATDIYPVGMMLAGLIGAQINGQVVSYAIPSSRGKPRLVNVIAAPMLYLEPNNPAIPRSGVNDWLDFIERCLAFKASERFGSAAECLEALDHLNTTHPLQENISISLLHRRILLPMLFQDGWKLCHVVDSQVW